MLLGHEDVRRVLATGNGHLGCSCTVDYPSYTSGTEYCSVVQIKFSCIPTIFDLRSTSSIYLDKACNTSKVAVPL